MAMLVICWTALWHLPPELMYEAEGREFVERRAWIAAERVKNVEFVVQTAQPPHLLVKAVAVLPAGEYDRVELVRVRHVLEPGDGMQVFRVVAVPATDAKPAAGAPPREVQVLHQWKNFLSEARWLRGVRVYATAGSVEKQWTDRPAVQDQQEGVKGKGDRKEPPQARDRIGTGNVNPRLDRIKRWKINLAYEDPKEFVKKLGELKIVVGARLDDGTFRIYSDLMTLPATPA